MARVRHDCAKTHPMNLFFCAILGSLLASASAPDAAPSPSVDETGPTPEVEVPTADDEGAPLPAADAAPPPDASPLDVSAPRVAPVPPDFDTIDTWLSSVVLLVTGPAYCSGAIIDDAGTVATAYHCVANGLKPEVQLRDGTRAIGRVVAAVPKDDLALISVPELAGKAPALAIHPSRPRQGERVWGLGHPFAPAADRTAAMSGMLLWSITEGIVSAVGPRLIQTDAALNPGNSGGPIVDRDGQIVGIASRKLGGDNVAFLASAERLRAIVSGRKKPMVLGGQLDLGVSSILFGTDAYSASSYMVVAHAAIRDRVVVGLGGALSTGARGLAFERGRGEAVNLEATLAGRARMGRGGWSTALDAGGLVFVTTGYTTEFQVEDSTWLVEPTLARVRPGAFARMSTAGVGFRWAVVPDFAAADPWAIPEIFVSIDLMVPGTVLTF